MDRWPDRDADAFFGSWVGASVAVRARLDLERSIDPLEDLAELLVQVAAYPWRKGRKRAYVWGAVRARALRGARIATAHAFPDETRRRFLDAESRALLPAARAARASVGDRREHAADARHFWRTFEVAKSRGAALRRLARDADVDAARKVAEKVRDETLTRYRQVLVDLAGRQRGAAGWTPKARTVRDWELARLRAVRWVAIGERRALEIAMQAFDAIPPSRRD